MEERYEQKEGNHEISGQVAEDSRLSISAEPVREGPVLVQEDWPLFFDSNVFRHQ